MEQTKLTQFYPFISNLVKLPESKVWSDYDKKSDVLYVSFGQPQKATDTIPTAEGVLVRKKYKKIIGFTILNGRFAQGVHEEAKYLFDGLREEERVVREKQAQLAEQSKRNFEDYVKESTTLTIPVIEVLIDELGK